MQNTGTYSDKDIEQDYYIYTKQCFNIKESVNKAKWITLLYVATKTSILPLVANNYINKT